MLNSPEYALQNIDDTSDSKAFPRLFFSDVDFVNISVVFCYSHISIPFLVQQFSIILAYR